ncbi:MAG: peptidase M61 [Chitinophagaceae bacterium]
MRFNVSISLIIVSFVASIFNVTTVSAQNNYRYSVDLTKAQDDQLTIELICPKITAQQTMFYLPKIVPGTYMNSNYGKYVHDLKAFNKAGKELPVKKSTDNGWEIKNAKSIYKLTYKVEDTWDSEIKNKVYPMCGTNFEAGKNFVINTPGLFGYFEGLKKNGFDLAFTKPANFYGATGLKPVSTSSTWDLFHCSNVDELYDSPIMFSLPDTTSIRVGNSDVLIAVYSPKKEATSKFIAANLEKLMMATKDYLGGKLPVDKYAFIFYFNGEQKKMEGSGAWEHSYSSFYSLDEEPQQEAIENWVDISSHEFFHIVTPLTISSREVKEFNFNETHLSKHVWLYEGSTEYYAHHVQVWAGLKTPEQFLTTMAQKINYSRSYFNDSLSFTELSTESAGKWKEQYVNVYMKGALISACLDLYLLKLSDGHYAFKDLKHDLGVKFGKDKFFEDAALFDEIEKLTYPEIKQFLLTYVQGSKPIPYEEYFGFAGVQYIPKEVTSAVTLGGVSIRPDGDKLVLGTQKLNEFGKKMGYQEGDELVSVNGSSVTANNIQQQIQQFNNTVKEGDKIDVIVKRKNANGEMAAVTLSAPAMKVEKIQLHLLRFDKSATTDQLKLRNAWLNTACKN